MTSPPSPLTSLDWVVKVGFPAATFILGFLVSRFTLSKRDKKDLEQKNYENSVALIAQHDAAYQAYTATIKSYCDAPQANANDFFNIATTGEKYFYALSLISSAILSDKVDLKLRDSVMLRKIKEATERTLPLHYQTLQDISKQRSIPYTGELRLADYESLFDVVSKFGAKLDWASDPGQVPQSS